MAKSKTVKVYPCDGCGYLVAAPLDGSNPKGFFGNVKEIHPDGNTDTVEFYAHTERCLKTAILNVTT